MESGVIPYWPTVGWYAQWLASRLSGVSSEELCAIANREGGYIGNRMLTRTVFELSGAVYSVPVVGGASSLKRLKTTELLISPHDNWQQQHLRTLATIYGKTPYWLHLSPRLQTIYDKAIGDKFVTFSNNLHNLIVSTILPGHVEESLHAALHDPRKYRLLYQRSLEESCDLNADTCIAAPLFQRGPETIFSLLHTFLKQIQP